MTSWFSQRECKITYSAVSYTGYYGVAAMIEDFAKPTDTEALSSIPLQFLVYVFNSNEACDERPDFTEETRPKGSCIGIPPGGTYFDRIIVRAGGPSKRWRTDVVMCCCCCCCCCCLCGYMLIQSTFALWTFYWKNKSNYKELTLYRLWMRWDSFPLFFFISCFLAFVIHTVAQCFSFAYFWI